MRRAAMQDPAVLAAVMHQAVTDGKRRARVEMGRGDVESTVAVERVNTFDPARSTFLVERPAAEIEPHAVDPSAGPRAFAYDHQGRNGIQCREQGGRSIVFTGPGPTACHCAAHAILIPSQAAVSLT